TRRSSVLREGAWLTCHSTPWENPTKAVTSTCAITTQMHVKMAIKSDHLPPTAEENKSKASRSDTCIQARSPSAPPAATDIIKSWGTTNTSTVTGSTRSATATSPGSCST